MPKTTDPVVAAGSMARSTQPRLCADQLVLRPWRSDDGPALVAAYGDPAKSRWHTRPMTAAEANEYGAATNRSWMQETAANWAVTEGPWSSGGAATSWEDLEPLSQTRAAPARHTN